MITQEQTVRGRDRGFDTSLFRAADNGTDAERQLSVKNVSEAPIYCAYFSARVLEFDNTR